MISCVYDDIVQFPRNLLQMLQVSGGGVGAYRIDLALKAVSRDEPSNIFCCMISSLLQWSTNVYFMNVSYLPLAPPYFVGRNHYCPLRIKRDLAFHQ